MSNDSKCHDFTPPGIGEIAKFLPSYEVVAFIAKGGMGAVYMARQKSLDREVAIKILPSHFVMDADFRARFEAEAKSMAKLNHPNVISVYDFGQCNDQLFIVMEMVKGKSLYHSACGKKIDSQQSALIIRDICLGLAHAHEQGILHRDLKPANILLTPNITAKIGDFGLAREVSDPQADSGYWTPGYTAPEVAKSPEAVNESTDLYSVGVMLYELLAGKRPEDPYIPILNIVECDPAFDRIICKAIDPSPAKRYRSAKEMGKAIDEVIKRGELSPPKKGDAPVARKLLVPDEAPHHIQGGPASIGGYPQRVDPGKAVSVNRLMRNLVIAILIVLGISFTWKHGWLGRSQQKLTKANDHQIAESKQQSEKSTSLDASKIAKQSVTKVDDVKAEAQVREVRSNKELRIVAASWGTHNKRADVRLRLEGYISDHSISIRANPKHLGDPSPYWKKYLNVKYSYDDKETFRKFREGSKVQIPTAEEIENAKSEAPTLPGDKLAFKGVRYQLVMQEMTWYEARNHCEQLGGHLAIINSKEEADFVAGLTTGKNTWLGATDAHKEGDWRWLDGTELNFNNWDDGEPNNLNKEHVLQMGSSGKWNDMSDGGKYYFVCEWSGALKHHYALRKSAEEGDPEALRNFAFSLQRGEGIAPDVKAAIKWFRKGAERGDIKCATALGWEYFTGKVLKQDHRAAMKWFRMGANAGDGGAELALGLYYSKGIGGVEQDHKEAVKWWRKAAKQGVSGAQYYLASAYFSGEGAGKNLEYALLLYQKVAGNQGDALEKQGSKQIIPQVQYELGEASYVKDDYRKAYEWYHKAAHQGYADAQYKLAKCYYQGKGVSADQNKAKNWLHRAEAQGHQDAREALNVMNKK
jgi:serine/threonine protein kinase/TPR repeat protein